MMHLNARSGLTFLLLALAPLFSRGQKPRADLIIHFLPVPLHSFIPDSALGAAFDGHPKGQNDLILRPANVEAMKATGLQPLSFRLRTELGVECWHWNPEGQWSGSNQGYWTSSSRTGQPIGLSYGYRLPRRGNTIDMANNDGYSRADDGDETTFWKSNPYLDSAFTHESNAKHVQWMVIDLGKEQMVDAIRIDWRRPYASRFSVEYGTADVYPYFDNSGYFDVDSPLLWKPFPHHEFTNAGPGPELLRLSDRPVKARMIRISLKEGAPFVIGGNAADPRDSIGFAIAEIAIGRTGPDGTLARDYVRHAPDHSRQSRIAVSSTDPWHRASDIDSSTEQLGIDRLFASGLTNHKPVLMTAGLLYDTPENVMAMLDYLQERNYPVEGLELGEEPDGQNANPEDYGALYAQWARRIARKYPGLRVGGPSFQTLIPDQEEEAMPTSRWMRRFLSELERQGQQASFRFCSFEWYPFDDVCGPSAPQLAKHPRMISKGMKDLRSIPGLKGIPVYISEYGYSAFPGINDVAIQSALMNADIVGQFLTLQGDKAFLYGLEPNRPDKNPDCAAGNNMLFGMRPDGAIGYRTATFYGALMMKSYWAEPSERPLGVYPVSCNRKNARGEELVSAYALLAPDSTWSLLIINKNRLTGYRLHISIEKQQERHPFPLPPTAYQYSGRQYRWVDAGADSHPSRSLPPELISIKNSFLAVPPYSLTVVRAQDQRP